MLVKKIPWDVLANSHLLQTQIAPETNRSWKDYISFCILSSWWRVLSIYLPCFWVLFVIYSQLLWCQANSLKASLPASLTNHPSTPGEHCLGDVQDTVEVTLSTGPPLKPSFERPASVAQVDPTISHMGWFTRKNPGPVLQLGGKAFPVISCKSDFFDLRLWCAFRFSVNVVRVMFVCQAFALCKFRVVFPLASFPSGTSSIIQIYHSQTLLYRELSFLPFM